MGAAGQGYPPLPGRPATLPAVTELPPDAEQHGIVPAVEPEPGTVVETRAERLAHRRRQTRLYAWAFLLVAFLVVLVALVVANTRHVKISWVVGSTRTSLIWIIIVSAVLGWFAGVITSLLFGRRKRRAR
jgi:uncharacterized integral membrane protein